jgi:hypothetical protein
MQYSMQPYKQIRFNRQTGVPASGAGNVGDMRETEASPEGRTVSVFRPRKRNRFDFVTLDSISVLKNCYILFYFVSHKVVFNDEVITLSFP